MKSKKMMKECFGPHAMAHNLFGLGIGLAIAGLIPSLGNIWIGLVIAIIALFMDYTGK
jgi:hypothetical protein